MVNSIEFKLFAPYNKEASLIGSFSDWEPILMTKDDNGYFRTTIELDDGNYQYKFRVRSKSWFFEPDQWVDVIDPYATNIDDSHQTGIITIKDGKKIIDNYVWKYDDVPLPSNQELVIYELHVADFSGGEDDPYPRGRYEHVIEKLDYLSELGINAIELMPIQEFPGDYSWGYNPRHFFATESSYGSTEELKSLIDECHARGIRVILDLVYNHAEAENPLTQIDYDYWYCRQPTDPEYNWGPEFDYQHHDDNLDIKPAWKFVGDNVCFWIQEYHIDGIRYDATKQLDNYDFLYWIVQQAYQVVAEKPFFNIAEYIPESTSITNFEGPMDSCWHASFCDIMKRHIVDDEFELEQLKDILDCKRQGFLGVANVINYLSSHDHERLMVELANRNIFDEAAFKRAKLGSVMLITAVGIPLIWMGEEFGEYQQKDIDESKIDWKLLKNDSNRNLWEYYKGLLHLRKNNHALRTANIDFFFEDPNAKVIAYTRWNDEGSRMVVIANFSDTYLAGYQVTNFPAQGKWHEWTRDYEIESGNDDILLDLPEYEAKILVWQ